MVLIKIGDKRYTCTNKENIERIFKQLTAAVTENLCCVEVNGILADMLWKLACALDSIDDDPTEAVLIANDPITALVWRGTLRMMGYNARVRLRPEGGTTREDLQRLRRMLDAVVQVANWD